MKAVRLLEYGGQLVFNNIPTPTIARDEILVKTRSTAVNHLDLVEASGAMRQILPIDLPWIPGHEFSGVVEQIGSDVAAFAPSDAVFGTTSGMGAYAEYLDPARRRAAIDEIFTEDCVFYEPSGRVYRGRDEIDRVAGTLRAMHPDFRYQPIAEPEELGNGGRVKWVEGRSSEPPAVAGTDFIIARDGRIAAVYLFFEKLP
jgi:Alcohol dehydrogenase GroES-like domain/SnoaL-like domain